MLSVRNARIEIRSERQSHVRIHGTRSAFLSCAFPLRTQADANQRQEENLLRWKMSNSTNVCDYPDSKTIAQSPLSPPTVNSNSCRTVSQHLSSRSSGWKLALRVIVGVESSTWSKLEVNSRGKVRRTMSRFMCLYRTMPTVRSLE